MILVLAEERQSSQDRHLLLSFLIQDVSLEMLSAKTNKQKNSGGAVLVLQAFLTEQRMLSKVNNMLRLEKDESVEVSRAE